jgi:hypothetical protein
MTTQIPTYSGQFCQVLYGGAEITLYFPGGDIAPTITYDNLDQTALRASGNPTATDIRRGVAKSEFTLKTHFDPVLCKFMRQYVGSRVGAVLQILAGPNYLPGPGDELFAGIYSIFSFSWPYVSNAVSMIDWEFKVPDGVATLPSIGLY